MAKGKVLLIGSNVTRIDLQGGTAPTGHYLDETVVPAVAVIKAGQDARGCQPKHLNHRQIETRRAFS